ncbi:MAG: type II 3-dehydroquinate dehydratase [Bowdeniella nasicola]|nr:type II 3-dehydroquinate dehydratase [Bowdeniella nasicola]
MDILVINGPNLGMLGVREPEIYGHTTLGDIVVALRSHARTWQQPPTVRHLQTDSVSRCIARLAQRDFAALIINPGAWTHYCYAIRDALAALDVPIVEVHISKVDQREAFRQINVIREVVTHTISGQGWRGYLEALDFLETQLAS